MYLNYDDLKKGMRAEILHTLIRGEENVALQAIAEAQEVVASYLSARYDILSEFQKTPESDNRLPMLIKIVRDIAIYHIHNFTAPVNIPENRIKSYEDAISLLKSVQAEKASIIGLKRLTTTSEGTVSSSYIAFGGNKKRQNHI